MADFTQRRPVPEPPRPEPRPRMELEPVPQDRLCWWLVAGSLCRQLAVALYETVEGDRREIPVCASCDKQAAKAAGLTRIARFRPFKAKWRPAR